MSRSSQTTAPPSRNSTQIDIELGSSNGTLSVRDAVLCKDQRPRPRFSHLWNDVDPQRATWQMVSYCFMSGYISVITFSAVFVFVGFQTGNSAQLAIAIARLLQGSSTTGRDTLHFHIADRQALTSLIAFNVGAFLGRVGDWFGCWTRVWLICGTMIQALLTMAATLALWKSGQGGLAFDRGDPSWTLPLTFVGLAFLSASMGLQGVMARRMNTNFGATVVLTQTWVDLLSDPQLLRMKYVQSREQKLMSIASLLLGAFLGRLCVERIGMEGTLAIGIAVRVATALSWLFVENHK